MDAYFHDAYDRLLPIKRILDNYPQCIPLQMKSGESEAIHDFLATGLQACDHELRLIYKPFLDTIVRDERLQDK